MDVTVYDTGVRKTLARGRVLRRISSIKDGVVFRGKVYPLHKAPDGAPFIEISNGSFKKSACPPIPSKDRAVTGASSVAPTTHPDAKLIAKIPTLGVEATIGMWKRAIEWSSGVDRSKQKRAIAVIEAIEKEWSKRLATRYRLPDFFEWPDPNGRPGRRSISSVEWMKLGMLKVMGYTVAADEALSDRYRRRILAGIFSGPLPPAFPRDYMDQWSMPSSASRLKKMAETIAAFARNANRRTDTNFHNAISRWESDLRWLRNEYYFGKFGFGWPETKPQF